MAREFARHESHRQRLEYNKKILVTECHIKIRDVEASMSVARNVLKEFYNSMPRKSADLIKAKGGATKYCHYDVGVQCRCVFIEVY